VNAGGSAITVAGVPFKADQYYRGGTVNTTTDPIAGTENDSLFQSERYGTYSYEVPVSRATYDVELYFNELYQTTAGSRAFSVAVEGQPLFSNLDLFTTAGHDTAYTRVIKDVAVSDGSLSISLSASIDNATISGFAIYSKTGTLEEVAGPLGRGENPFVQTNYTADPAPVVYGDRLYVYTSHDEDVTVNNFYTMNDWRLYSTTDMVNWTDHGSPAGYRTFSWGRDSAWAVQAIERNGKYYLYVPLNNNSGSRIGVAVADNPVGPYKDPLGKHLAQGPTSNIDPTVFIDDDGQAYMYWGNGTLQYVKLNQDMISYSGSIQTASLSGFVEGPWAYKRGSTYYMVYAASGNGSEKISYATASRATGPWTYKGDIMDAGRTYTNHPGVVDYKGHSYFFYHDSSLPGGNNYKRSVRVQEFKYGSDGSIPKLSMTGEGPEGLASLNPFMQVEAETIAFSSGVKTENCTDTGGGQNVTQISVGDYIKVKNVNFGSGVASFAARVSSSTSNAKIELRLDSKTGTLVGTCDVSGRSSWTTVTCPASGASGTHDLFLVFAGSGDNLFKFNWWKFE
ncbi:MAG TPA: family 43 glycosylhydrolase, partial [Cellvibrionaceae bacterium]|nr:family 43 glycosylhydrolase [Cellvibrionaceae bacterium]